jgi:hypothetical protein
MSEVRLVARDANRHWSGTFHGSYVDRPNRTGYSKYLAGVVPKKRLNAATKALMLS